MSEKERFIAACGIPPMVVAACNALGTYIPVQTVDEKQLHRLRPEGWLLSTDVLVAHINMLLPYRRHIIVVTDTGEKDNFTDGTLETVLLYGGVEEWQRVFAVLEENGSPYGMKTSVAPLSRREKEVLRQIASGLTAKEIADKLGISANTVVTHRKNLSAKLGIRSTSGLSLYALMNGFI